MNIISEDKRLNRRGFMKVAAAAAAASLVGSRAWGEQTKSGDMIYRPLGSTGVRVSAIGLGGYHIGNPPESEGIALVRSAVDRGITFLDNSWDYHAGESELRMGKALCDGYRDKVCLMTKINARSKENAEKQIHQSLSRLQTDHLDLLQFHEILRPNDPEKIFAGGGALEAAVAAQKAGKVRFIGFTGHKDPAIHLHMLDVAARHQFKFDAVQMPLNVMDAHFRSFQRDVVPVLVRDKIGVLGMKSMGSGNILKTNLVTARECVQYALNLPTSVVIVGMDNMAWLDEALKAAAAFHPMSKPEVAALLAKTADPGKTGEHELFKISTMFDSLDRQPESFI